MARHDTSSAAIRARQAHAELFFGALASAPATMESFEDEALALGHAAMAEATASALERYDARLCASLPAGSRVHDRRRRTLATKVGDVSFAWTRVRDGRGFTEVPLADALDLPHGCRVSPAASAFLVEAGAEVSYARAARLLSRAGGSRVSASAVMLALRSAGSLCAEEDAALARSLYGDGVLPGGSEGAEELCLEADGTWFSVQKPAPGQPRRLEVKAVVAYAGKESAAGASGASASRATPWWARPASSCPRRWRPWGRATTSRRSSGCTSAPTGRAGASCRRVASEGGGGPHLDPFHVNRAVLSCFPDPKMGWRVLEAL